MIEVLWHGRGGQGAFTAARLLGAAASLGEGKYALAFPSFGPERRGAPMRAFTKMDGAPIGNRSAVEHADFVVYLDETLLGFGWDGELKPGGRVLVNSTNVHADKRIIALDADGISSAILGRAIPNTVFLAAIALLCDRVSIEEVQESIRQYMPEKLHAKNLAIIDAVQEAFEGILRDAEKQQAFVSVDSTAATIESDVAEVGSGDARPKRPASQICSLKQTHLDSSVYARNTCFEAGHLVTKNAGWRNIRPVISAEVCKGCYQCYLLCPDGAIFKSAGECPVALDLDFCKGCGICAKACPFDAISMVLESEADAR